MVGNLVLRGIIVGIVAGLLAFGFANVFGERSTEAGIAFEEHAAAAAGEPAEPEMISRGLQTTIGLLSGTVVMGAGFGALFAVMFAFANGRMGRLGEQQTSALLAFLCWLAIYFVPFLKYPPNPPGSSDPSSINFRSAIYLLLLAISIATTIGAWLLRQQLVRDYGTWYASLMAAGAFVVTIAAFYLVLPSVNETPEGFPAPVIYEFRMASIGIQVVLWGTIGLLFGFVVERTMAVVGSPQRPSRPTGITTP